MPAPFLPYCGAPPLPETLWLRWNLDPVLILVLAAVLWAYLRGSRHLSRAERINFTAGWGIAAVAVVSPLCALSVSLFSARIGQHMFLTLMAAPLMALGRPGVCLGALLPERWRMAARQGNKLGRSAGAAAFVFACCSGSGTFRGLTPQRSARPPFTGQCSWVCS